VASPNPSFLQNKSGCFSRTSTEVGPKTTVVKLKFNYLMKSVFSHHPSTVSPEVSLLAQGWELGTKDSTGYNIIIIRRIA